MKINFIILFLLFSKSLLSQGLLINSGNLVISNNTHVVLVSNSNWTNNATVNCMAGSTVDFTGNARQSILGTNTTTFHNLTINNSHADGVWVGRDIGVNNTLLMTQGHFNLRDYIVTFSNTATLSNEAETRRVRATSAAGAEGMGIGTIRTTRVNPSGNVAGLGLNYTPAVALGNTLFIRGHERQQGSGSFTGNYSVFRYYELQPATMTTLTINNFNYWGGGGNPELNGHIEANLQMYQRVNYGGPTYWEPEVTIVNTGSDFVSSSTVNNSVGGAVRITLGSTTLPLPVDLISFTGLCKKSYNYLLWQTASEFNNDYFLVEKSLDGEYFSTIAQVFSTGNNNTLKEYALRDDAPFNGVNYYRLHQYDKNGTDSYSSIISLNCFSNATIEDLLPISPSNEFIEVIIQGVAGKKYLLSVTNILGQTILDKEIEMTDNNQTVRLLETGVSPGMYYIVMQSEDRIISKPILLR